MKAMVSKGNENIMIMIMAKNDNGDNNNEIIMITNREEWY